MAHAPARHGAGGGAKIAEKWRISADFDPICRGPVPIITASETRAFVRGSRPAGCWIVARCRRDLPARSRPAGYRIAVAGCRITANGSRAGMFGAWGAGHGAACFTDLIRQRWPVSGHKKSPAGNVPAGRLSACGGLKCLTIQSHRLKLPELGFRLLRGFRR